MEAEAEAEAETEAEAEAAPEPLTEPQAEDVAETVARLLASLELVETERDQLLAAKAKQDGAFAKLTAQAASDARTIEKLRDQVAKMAQELMGGSAAEEGVPPEGGGDESSEDEFDETPAAGAEPEPEPQGDGPSSADVEKRRMIEEMFASGTITEQEYDEMVSRMEREREHAQHLAAQKAAWQDVADAFNGQAKKGVAAMEREWNNLGVAEPYSAGAVARLFLKHAGAAKDQLDRREIGEFLAGGKPFMAAVREAFADLFEFSGMTFVESLRTFLANFKMPGESMLIERLMTAFARVRFLPARLPASSRSGFRLHMPVLNPC